MISFRYLSIFRTTFSLKCVFPCACGISLGNHLQSQNCFSSVLLSWPISHESLEISGPLTCRIHILAKTQRDVGQHEREPGWPGADPRFRGKEASRFTSAFLARRGCCYHTTVAKRSWRGGIKTSTEDSVLRVRPPMCESRCLSPRQSPEPPWRILDPSCPTILHPADSVGELLSPTLI